MRSPLNSDPHNTLFSFSDSSGVESAILDPRRLPPWTQRGKGKIDWTRQRRKKESEGGEHGQLMSYYWLNSTAELQPRTLKKVHRERKRKHRSEETVKWWLWQRKKWMHANNINPTCREHTSFPGLLPQWGSPITQAHHSESTYCPEVKAWSRPPNISSFSNKKLHDHQKNFTEPRPSKQWPARTAGELSPRMSFIRQRLFSSPSPQNVALWLRWESRSEGGSGPGSGRNQEPTTPDNGQPAPFWSCRVQGRLGSFHRFRHRSRDVPGGCGPLLM